MAPEVNLLPHIERVSPGRRWLSIILAVVFALLLIYLGFQYFTVNKKIKSLEAEQQVLQNEKTDLESSIVILDAPQEVDLGMSVTFIENVSYPISPLLVEINKYVHENTYLRDYVFSENTIQFSVDFETMGEVVSYVADLAGSTYFEDVKVEQISTFDPKPSAVDEEDEENTESFDEVERFANTFTVIIDPQYLLTGGEVQ